MQSSAGVEETESGPASSLLPNCHPPRAVRSRNDNRNPKDEDKINALPDGIAVEVTSKSSAKKKRKTRETSDSDHSPDRVERMTSRHDGKIIAFPLGEETFYNLALLREAANDISSHLKVVKKRIQELELEVRQKDERINPWDRV